MLRDQEGSIISNQDLSHGPQPRKPHSRTRLRDPYSMRESVPRREPVSSARRNLWALFPPPAFCECRHRVLACCCIAVCRRPILMMPQGQRPHPRGPDRRSI